MPQQRKKEESERLIGERDKIKFINLRLEICLTADTTAFVDQV